jgi:hypothetical protein
LPKFDYFIYITDKDEPMAMLTFMDNVKKIKSEIEGKDNEDISSICAKKYIEDLQKEIIENTKHKKDTIFARCIMMDMYGMIDNDICDEKIENCDYDKLVSKFVLMLKEKLNDSGLPLKNFSYREVYNNDTIFEYRLTYNDI